MRRDEYRKGNELLLMTTANQENEILPEEEPLFREFESYVRSIYTQASRGVIEELENAVVAYRTSVTDLTTKTAGLVINLDDRVIFLMKTVETCTSELSEALKRLLVLSAESINEPLKAATVRMNDALTFSTRGFDDRLKVTSNGIEQRLNVSADNIDQKLMQIAANFHEQLVISLAQMEEARDTLNLSMSSFHSDMKHLEQRVEAGLEAEEKRADMASESLKREVSSLSDALTAAEHRLQERQKWQHFILLGTIIIFNLISWVVFALLYLKK